MVAQAEDRRAVRRVVAADALEYAGAVVEPVRGDVDLRVRPVDELAVHPDLLGLLHFQLSFEWTNRTFARRRRPSGGPGPAAQLGRADSEYVLWSRRPPRRCRAGRAPCPSARRRPSAAGTVQPHRARSPSHPRPPARSRRAPTRVEARATFAGSPRRSPGTRATTGRSSQMRTSDFTIWSRSQPTAAAASCAVGVPSGNSWMRASAPDSRRKEDTRSTGSGQAPTTAEAYLSAQ